MGDLREMPTFLPSLALSTDNAAMIAAAGLRQFRAGARRRPISTRTHRCDYDIWSSGHLVIWSLIDSI